MDLKTSLGALEEKPPPTADFLELETEPEPVYVILELGHRTKLLKAFRDENTAKKHLTQVKEDNADFGNPPPVLIRRVDLY